MPASLQALISDRRMLRVPVNGKPLDQCGPDEIVTLVYRPSAVNLDAENKAREMRAAGDSAVLRLAKSLRDHLDGWDVLQYKPKLDAEGQPVVGPDGAPVYEVGPDGKPVTEPLPLTVETLGSLGILRLNEWHRAISEDMFPDPTTPATSSLPGSPVAGS